MKKKEVEIFGELTPSEKLLGFRVRDGMVWVDGALTQGWSVPRIDHMQKAVKVIDGLLDEFKKKIEDARTV